MRIGSLMKKSKFRLNEFSHGTPMRDKRILPQNMQVHFPRRTRKTTDLARIMIGM